MRATAWLLTKSNQERLGHVSPECTAGGGLLLGVWVIDRDGETIPQGIFWDGDIAGTVAGGEDFGMVGVGGHLGWGDVSSPSDRIRGPEEVPPAVVVLCAALHPGHRDGISGGGG